MISDHPMPGAVLAEYLGGLSLIDAAAKIGIGPDQLSNVINGLASIDANLAIKIGRALGTSAALWTGLQSAFDAKAADALVPDNQVQDLKGMRSPPPGVSVSVEYMHASLEQATWDKMAPIGREFGSPDYERLEELDNLAFKAKGSLLKARRWLDTPNGALDGLTPEEVARTPEGLARVKRLLSS